MRNTAIWENYSKYLYQTCSFVENRRYVHKTHTISFYYVTNKYDKSKLETEEHVDDYFTSTTLVYIYTIIYERTLYYVRQFH